MPTHIKLLSCSSKSISIIARYITPPGIIRFRRFNARIWGHGQKRALLRVVRRAQVRADQFDAGDVQYQGVLTW